MTDINDLVQDISDWRTSSDGAVGPVANFFAIRRLFEILKKCHDNWKVCFDILFPFLRLPST
jgi:hypothetical protein